MSTTTEDKPRNKKRPASAGAAAAANVEENPVFSLQRDTQVNLLSEALLREFMHKRKFLQTLKQFDAENPRNEMTITSRAVMQELMTMQKVMHEMKSKGIDSIVEAVCEHRIEKKAHVQEAHLMKKELEELQLEAKKIVEETNNRRSNIEKLKAEIANLEKQQQEVEASSKKEKKKKDSSSKKDKDKKKKKKNSSSKNKKNSRAGNDDAITSIDDLLEDKEEHVLAAKKAEQRMHLQQQQEEEERRLKKKGILGNSSDDTDDDGNNNNNSGSDEDDNDNNESDGDDNETENNDDNDNENNNNNTRRGSSVSTSGSTGRLSRNTNNDRPPTSPHPVSSTTQNRTLSGIPQLKVNNQEDNDGDDNLSVNSGASSSSSSDSEDDYEAGLRRIREEAMKENKLVRKNSLSTDGSLPRRRSWNVTADNNNDSGSLAASSNNLNNQSPGVNSNNDNNNSTSIHSRADASESSSSIENSTNNNNTVDIDSDDQVGTSLASSLVAMMVGKHKKIPASFFQPIIFSRVQSHSYGLVQKMGGPCGAIAALQARILSKWFFSSSSSSSSSSGKKKVLNVLNAALTTIFEDILTVRNLPEEPAVFVIPPPSKDTPFDTLQKQVSALSHCVLLEERSARVYPYDLLTEAWTTSPWGLVCFILSCVLTRTRGQGTSPAEAIFSHMDEPRSLVVEHGYCSQEMVNLLLCGWATSHVHDGVIHVNATSDNSGIALKGLYNISPGKPLDVGFISMMEVRKMLEVGSLGKNPQNPVWIVYNESHYTVLFAKDNSSFDADSIPSSSDSSSTPAKSFDLFYYDPQVEEDEYRVTVTPSKMPLPAARANALISFVDQIIRTREGWKNARISWNGADPLL